MERKREWKPLKKERGGVKRNEGGVKIEEEDEGIMKNEIRIYMHECE